MTRAVEALHPVEKRKTRLEVFGERFGTAAVILTKSVKGLLVVVAVALVVLVIRDVRKDVLQIDSIAVPSAWEQQGYSSRAVANLMMDEIRAIKVAADTENLRRDVSLGREESLPDVQIPVAGLSLSAVSNFMRAILKRYPTTVTGDIIVEQGDAVLSIRMTSQSAAVQTETIRAAIADRDDLIRKAAAHVVKQVDPCVLASAYISRKEFANGLDTAIHCLSQGHPDDHPWAYNLWGLVRHERRDYDGAIEKYEEAIKLNSAYVVPYNNLGWVLETKKAYEAAIVKYRKAIEVDPKYFLAHNNLANMLRREKDYAGAIAQYEEIIAIDPRNADAYNNVGNVLFDQKNYAGAIAKYQKAIELNPRFSYPRFNWGLALAAQENYTGAIAKYQEAIEIDSKYADAYFNWGLALLARNDYSGAVVKFHNAAEHDPAGADIQRNLGDALMVLKDRAGAAAAYRKATELDPDGVEGKMAREKLKSLQKPKST